MRPAADDAAGIPVWTRSAGVAAASQIHRLVQDPHNFNSRYVITEMQHEVVATPPSSSHVEATQARLDLVARCTVRKVGPSVKRCERGNKRASVHQALAVAQSSPQY